MVGLAGGYWCVFTSQVYCIYMLMTYEITSVVVTSVVAPLSGD